MIVQNIPSPRGKPCWCRVPVFLTEVAAAMRGRQIPLHGKITDLEQPSPLLPFPTTCVTQKAIRLLPTQYLTKYLHNQGFLQGQERGKRDLFRAWFALQSSGILIFLTRLRQSPALPWGSLIQRGRMGMAWYICPPAYLPVHGFLMKCPGIAG